MTNRPGFVAGALTLVEASKRLTSTPRLWPYALVPSVVFATTVALLLNFGASRLIDVALTESRITNVHAWYGKAGEVLLTSALWISGAVLAVWIALVITPPLCAPALEHLVRDEEQRLQAVPRRRISIWQEWWCGLQAQAIGLSVIVPLWLGLSLLNLLLPALLFVTLPLKVLAVSLALAWSLLDYPLTLRGIPATQRLRLFRSQPRGVLGFGLAFAAVFWLPCASVLLLPVGAVAATRLVWRFSQLDPAWAGALPVETLRPPHPSDPTVKSRSPEGH